MEDFFLVLLFRFRKMQLRAIKLCVLGLKVKLLRVTQHVHFLHPFWGVYKFMKMSGCDIASMQCVVVMLTC